MSNPKLPVQIPQSLRSRYAAAAMSLIFGGTGHIYLKQQKKGLLIIVAALLLTPTGLGLLLIPLGMYDAYVIGGRIERGKRVRDWEWFWQAEEGASESSSWHILNIVATDRSENPLGTDERLIDNAQSSVNLTRNLKLQKEWTKSYSIQYEQAYRESVQTNHQVTEFLSTKRAAEKLLRKKYGISEREKHLFEEVIAIKVAPEKKVRLCLHWKQILQNGIVVLSNQHGEKANVPFTVIVGLTFDQTQIDEH